MDKQTFTVTDLFMKESVQAVEVYGADANMVHHNNKAYYNTGVDSVLDNVAAIALKEMEVDLDRFENGLETYLQFNENQKHILGEKPSDKAKKILGEYNSVIYELIDDIRQECFKRGFNAGYKFSKNTELD